LRTARQIVDIAAVTAHFSVVAREQATLLDAALEARALPRCYLSSTTTAPEGFE
jgi:hypothetical protein